MPQLSALQWIIVIVFQAFYGFAVFALTQDYYERQMAVQAVMGTGANPARPHPDVNKAVPEPELPPIAPPTSQIPDSMAGQDPVLLAQQGDEYFRGRQYAEAIRLYRRVLTLNPSDVDTHNDLGLALHYSGNSAAALRVLKQGVEKDPSFQRIWLTLGFVQMYTDERPEAKFALQHALALGGDNGIGEEAQRLLDKLATEDGARP